MRLQNTEKQLWTSLCLSAHLSVHKEQLGSYWTDFHEIWYLTISQKTVKKIQAQLQCDKINEYVTYIYNSISLNAS